MLSAGDYCSGLAAFIRQGKVRRLHTLFRPPFDPAIAALYRNGYFRSCREVLAGTFTSVVAELGEDAFAGLAREYARHHPPRQGTLTGYGEYFADWLESHVDREWRWLTDLALLDWAWLQCLHGPDATPLSPTDAQRLFAAQQSEWRIAPLGNAHLLQLSWPVLERWACHKSAEPIANPEAIAADSRWVLFWRPRMSVRVQALRHSEFQMLTSLRNRNDACLTGDSGQMPPDAADVFRVWLMNGVLEATPDAPEMKS